MDAITALTTALGASWASGVNLYACVAMLGCLHRFGAVELPGSLDVHGRWPVIAVAAALYAIEFVADKIPYVDSLWDGAHTFIRVPAGAILALGAVTNLDPAAQVIVFMIGGGVALTAHGTKAAARLAINTSPEPVTNAAVSIAEDGFVFSLVALLAFHPILAACLVLAILAATAYLAPKIFRLLAAAWRRAKAAITWRRSGHRAQ
jgi:hypothetical protein